jgi:cell division protein FtsB
MKKIISALKNKYILTVIILAVWVLFFDKNDLKTQIEFKKQVKQLEEERNYYAKENTEVSRELKELTTNRKTIEKFAREKYYMKRDNEDIFVIVEEPAYAETPADKTP